VSATQTCRECGQKTTTVERARGGQVEILVTPSETGDLYRLPHGKDAGKYLHIEGPLLTRMRFEGKHLHNEHACKPGGLF
jgi:hypothetical protein